MPAAMELLTGFVTAPSTTQTALTMATGNTLTVRNCPFEKMVKLLTFWADNQGAGIFRVRSPKMHDNVQGIRSRITVANTAPRMPRGPAQRLYAQDTLTADLSGSATAGDIETAAMLLWYEDLPGAAARLITPADVLARGVQDVTVENALATGTAGGYSGEAALNATFDLLKANTDYALVGYNVDAECACVRWRGTDSGNLGIGGPGAVALHELTAAWFWDLAMKLNLPLIPVFNSANKAGILVDAAQDENGTDVNVNSFFVELSPVR